jgi:hypothetical protein
VAFVVATAPSQSKGMKLWHGHLNANQAPAPNRRPPFALGSLAWFGYHSCAPPAFSAAVGEARRSVT